MFPGFEDQGALAAATTQGQGLQPLGLLPIGADATYRQNPAVADIGLPISACARLMKRRPVKRRPMAGTFAGWASDRPHLCQLDREAGNLRRAIQACSRLDPHGFSSQPSLAPLA